VTNYLFLLVNVGFSLSISDGLVFLDFDLLMDFFQDILNFLQFTGLFLIFGEHSYTVIIDNPYFRSRVAYSDRSGLATG
jgi:hypothetical protein